MDNDSLQQWKSLGARIKAIESEMRGVLIDSQALRINKKTLQELAKSMKYLSAFKGDMEDVMYSRANSDERKEGELLHVFYGGVQE